MNKLISSFILIFFTMTAFGQNIQITGTKRVTNPELYTKFRQVDQYEINIEDIRRQLSSATDLNIKLDLQLNQEISNFQVYEYKVYRENAKIRIQTANGIIERAPNPDLKFYRGIETSFNGGVVAFTIAKDFFSMMYYKNGVGYFIEQYSGSDPTATPNTFNCYRDKDVIPVPGVECGFDKVNKAKQDHKPQLENEDELDHNERNKRCYLVDIALACEVQYTIAKGGAGKAENDMLNIVNLMSPDWVNGLWDEYNYGVTEVWVSEDPAKDPWRNAGDIFDHLNIFTFAQATIFTTGYDCATLWTNKFTSGAVGVAYLSTICTFQGVNVCSEFTPVLMLLRQVQSHELGHNFSCTHDPAGQFTIMAPVVNGSQTWSFQSQNQIWFYTISSGTCLSDCGGGRIPVAEFEAEPVYGCIPLRVQYTNLSANATSYKWTFSGGIPATSTDVNPVVVYPGKGVFDVSLEAINPQCSVKLNKEKYIETNDKPTSNFEGASQFEERTVLFVNNSTNATEWKWTFGDGNMSDEFQPEHTYDKDSTYRVCLTSTNDCGSTTFCKNISVATFPQVDFEADTTWGCAPKTIKFFDMSSNNVIAWNWEFPGGTPSTSTAKNPVVKYSNPGVFSVKLSVNSRKYVNRKTKEMYIRIDSLPDPGFDYQVNGSTVDFSNQSRYAKSHEWNFGDNTPVSTQENPSHTYTKAGRYEVTYYATNDCGTTTQKKFIIIGSKPTAGFQTDKPAGCAPYTVQFENTSTASATDFLWSFPGGNPSSSTDKNPVVTYQNKGKYDVKLVAKNALESDSITINSYIDVKLAPTSAFNHSITGFNSFFTNMSQEATSYYWDFGDNKGTSSEANPTYNYGVEGEFNVRLVAESECGVDTFEKLIAVYLIPKVNFRADTIRGCAPFLVQFQDRSSIDVIEWNWQFEEGLPLTSTQKNPMVRFNKAGFYTVKLSVKNTNGTNSETKVRYIEVLSPVLCPKKPNKKGPKSQGDEQFEQVDMSGRTSNSNLETRVFPNPTNDILHLQSIEGSRYQLVNATGQVVLSGITTNIITAIAVNQLNAGSYYIRVENSKKTETLKLMISK